VWLHARILTYIQEVPIARPGKTTIAKRDREKAKQMKQREKDDRRAQRKAEKPEPRPRTAGEDPDLEGLQWGPQPPSY
jgi:hypothetical protein